MASTAAAVNARPPAQFRRAVAASNIALPMPTTGPAALPGHGRSLATGTSAAVPSPASTDPTPQEPAETATSTWFVSQFNDAMDKYQKAARLGTISAAAPASAPVSTAN
jgi:hypothetical protein